MCESSTRALLFEKCEALASMPAHTQPPDVPPLVPKPRRFRARRGSLVLAPTARIILATTAARGGNASAEFLREAIRLRCGFAPTIHRRSRPRAGDIVLALQRGRGVRAQDAYLIRVRPASARLTGSDASGLYYAAQTFTALLDTRGRAPCCDIDDAPAFALRGILLDISRGKVPNERTLRELVDFCAQFKLNALMLYTEHTFRFRKHPAIGAGASPLDAKTLRALDAYATQRNVALIPTLQSLGHMSHILSLPRYQKLAETDLGWTLSPAEPNSYRLLRDLCGEYLPLFRSPYFNANCDEPFDLARGKSKAREERLGPGGVFLEHVRRVRALASRFGKRTMIWADAVHQHPKRIPEFPRDLVFLDWWYEARHDYERVRIFKRHGFDFCVCPGTSSWNALFPRVENSLENIRRYARAGRRHGALGLIVTDWGDFGHYNLLGNSWFAFAWAAQQAWSGDLAARDFDRGFARQWFGDTGGGAAQIYRALGAVHDVGFQTSNASPLQYLFFDDLAAAHFTQAAKAVRLRRAEQQLLRVRRNLNEQRRAFRGEPLSWRELVYAADASLFAARKAFAGRNYVAWRRRPKSLTSRGRKQLALSLRELAREQLRLKHRLHQLWLARSAPSNFEIVGARIDRSLRGLRRAARALESNRPPAPPLRPADMQPSTLIQFLRNQR